MAALLPRGANAALTREVPSLKRLIVGVRFAAGAEVSLLDNLVLATLLCGADGHVLSAEHVVFFNQLTDADLSVAARDAALGDDSEQVEIALETVPPFVHRIVFVAYVNEAIGAHRTLAQLKDCTIRAVNADGNAELVRSENLAKGWGPVTAAVLAEVYRLREEWKFKVIGESYAEGIKALAADFKVPL